MVPPVTIEEIHTCLLCNGITKEGKERKDAKNLEMMQCVTLNHYATCLYEQEDGLKFYEETYPILVDVESPSITTEYQFYCPDEGCKRSKRLQGGVGYKQYVTHQALYHGGLELYMETRVMKNIQRLYFLPETFAITPVLCKLTVFTYIKFQSEFQRKCTGLITASILDQF